MRAMPVVVVKEEREALGALGGVRVSMSVGPFAERGLDEALGFAIGLGSVGLGKAVLEAEGGGGGGHGVSAVAGAVIGVDALGFDAVAVEEGEGGMQESDGTARGLIWEELSESEAGMIVDGDVEILPAGARSVIALAISGDAVARADDAGELFDVEMDEFARLRAFVAADRQRGLEGGELVRMTAEEARDTGLGKLGRARNLEAWQLAASQSQDTSDAEAVSAARRRLGARRAILEPWEAFCVKAREPLVSTALGDAEVSGDLGDWLGEIEDASDHLGSTARGELGLTVNVHAAVRGGWLGSHPHLTKSSPHEQPIGTSHLGRETRVRE